MARHKHQPRHFLRETAAPLFERAASIGPSSINEADRSFEMVFATDALIGGHRLAITPENVSKATGVSLLDSHNRSSLSNVIGVVGETSIVGNEARARVQNVGSCRCAVARRQVRHYPRRVCWLCHR